ncbi:MAG: PKD domain-containing protein [Actinomycetota bacterium]|nr:PKD domain-containing protein [Actinomycetota bacterium]
MIAADRAMALAPSPVIEVAPEQIGLTGLDSFFWLAEAPGPITATAGVSGLTVTAEARPVEYVWDFGDGQEKVTTEPGRPWTKASEGSISHLYEATGSYDLGVEIVWRARWRADDGGWQQLGVFSSSAGEPYPVKEVVSVLVSTEE